MLPDLLHGEETRVCGDGAYQGQTEVIHECAPRARDFTQRRCRYKGQIVDEVAWAKNRTKSKVRARVEHVFQVKKNAHRLFVTCALVNRFMSRRKLLAVA
jgi:IS5 family transposase